MKANSNLWGGRFAKEINHALADFNSSISFDGRMFREDIEGSIAHADMLGKTGIIDLTDADKIISGLTEILNDIDSGALEISPQSEDIHMFVEAELTKRLGDIGKKLHTARSRNDQVALDIRIYLKKEIKKIRELLIDLLEAVTNKAEQEINSVMPGYTHLQRAQPVTFGHYMMAYAQMFKRDVTRLDDCFDRMNIMPLGSGALASTTYNIDRNYVCEKLGFRDVTDNSLDGVSDRDFVLELCSDIAIIMTHMSRFAEEIIYWCSWEFKFIELDDAYATGSSMMPQKKNPDLAELVRGKAGRVYGNMITLFTLMKALPLAYNKDMQEDKPAVFDSIDTVKACLSVFAPMIETLSVLPENMRSAAQKGFINATDCADYLTKKGVPFRDAYTITGGLVGYCIENNKTLETMDISEYKKHSDIFESDIFEAVSLDTCVNQRKVYGGPATDSVKKQIDKMRQFIKNA